MSKKSSSDQKDHATRLRRAGDFLASEIDRYPPGRMFDSFWRAGEVALMFGPAGVGKSLLAMQVADALARGRPIEGFEMARSRRKVLFVDLKHSDRQFAERYSYRVPVPRFGSVLKACKFAENLYRSRLPANEELCEWLAGQIGEHGFNVVIVDDLTALKKTHDGVREMLAAMRMLKKLSDEMRVSVLAITASEEPCSAKAVGESDLKRSSVLCGVADSVFGICRGRADCRYVIQTRSRNAPVQWTVHNAPSAQIARAENDWPGFAFDERFAAPIDPQTRDAICRVRAMRQAGKTWRAISAELGIPKTRAVRLFQKWTPEMGEDEFVAEYAEPSATEAELAKDQASSPPYEGGVDARVFCEQTGWFSQAGDDPALDNVESASNGREPPRQPKRLPPLLRKEGSRSRSPDPPQLYGPNRVSVFDLKRGFTRDGEEIFIEIEEEDTRRPKVWYKFDRKGTKFKSVRDSLGITSTRLGPTEFL